MKTIRLLIAAGFALPFFLTSLSLTAQTGDTVLVGPGGGSGAPIFSKVVNSPATTTPGDSRSVNWIDVDNDTAVETERETLEHIQRALDRY